MGGPLGNTNAKGKRWTMSKEGRERISKAKLGNTNVLGKHWTMSKQGRENVSHAKKGKQPKGLIAWATSKEGRERNTGSNNVMWKGDDVSRKALHLWVKRHLVKPDLCQNCMKSPAYHLSSINHVYSRNLDTWQWLCAKCHFWIDGRFKNLKQFREK
jgi:hypothetical protein